MKKFILGFILGLLFGSISVAVAAKVVGYNGYLIGRDVISEGETKCSDPYV